MHWCSFQCLYSHFKSSLSLMVFSWLTLSCRLHVQCVQLVQATCRPLTVVTYWLFHHVMQILSSIFSFVLSWIYISYLIALLLYIIFYYFYFTLIYVLPFLLSYLLITSQERGGCYPGLTSVTHIHDWDLRLTRFPINRSNSIMSIDLSLIHSIYIHILIVLSSIIPSLHYLWGPVDSLSLV